MSTGPFGRSHDRWGRKQERWGGIRSSLNPSCGSPGLGLTGAPSLIGGSLVVLVGLILLLDNLGIVHARDFWQYWPVAFIALGASRILSSRALAGMVWGTMLTIAGVLFLLANLGIFYFNLNLLWPLLIVGAGVTMLMRGVGRTNPLVDPQNASGLEPTEGSGAPLAANFGSPGYTSNTIHLWAVFGGSRRRVDTPDFRGGEVLAVFGGFQIDLRGAGMQSGRAVIDVNTICGGVEIQVPPTWAVEMRGVGIFGGFGDETMTPRVSEGAIPPVLVVTGYTIFGGANVKN